MITHWFASFAVLAGSLGADAAGAIPRGATRAPIDPLEVLVFTKTAAFRHASIPAGVAAIRELGDAHCFGVTDTEDSAAFEPGNLARYSAVVFLSTTGDVLDAAQESAFEAFIRAGGGFVGVHAAADTEYDWPFYAELIGAYFQNHPAIQSASIHVEDAAHLSTQSLPLPPASWDRSDEWYNFREKPAPARARPGDAR